MKHSS